MLLEIDGTIVIAGLSFVVFVIVMNMIFYRPVQNIIEKRNSLINDEKEDIENNNAQKGQLIEQKQNEIMTTNLKAKELMNEITSKYKLDKQKLIDDENLKSKEELEALKSGLENEVKEIQNNSDRYVEEISQTIVDKILARGGENA